MCLTTVVGSYQGHTKVKDTFLKEILVYVPVELQSSIYICF